MKKKTQRLHRWKYLKTNGRRCASTVDHADRRRYSSRSPCGPFGLGLRVHFSCDRNRRVRTSSGYLVMRDVKIRLDRDGRRAQHRTRASPTIDLPVPRSTTTNAPVESLFHWWIEIALPIAADRFSLHGRTSFLSLHCPLFRVDGCSWFRNEVQ